MDFSKIARASDVITSLQKLIEKHGDLPICADDPDTSWRLPIGIVHKTEDIEEEFPERFEIKTEYNFDPDGIIVHGE